MATQKVTGEQLVAAAEKRFTFHFPSTPAVLYRRKLVEALDAVLTSTPASGIDSTIATLTPTQLCDTDTGRIAQDIVRHFYGYDASPQRPENYLQLWRSASEETRNYVYTLMYHVIAPRYPRENPGLAPTTTTTTTKKRAKKRKKPDGIVPTATATHKKLKKVVAS